MLCVPRKGLRGALCASRKGLRDPPRALPSHSILTGMVARMSTRAVVALASGRGVFSGCSVGVLHLRARKTSDCGAGLRPAVFSGRSVGVLRLRARKTSDCGAGLRPAVFSGRSVGVLHLRARKSFGMRPCEKRVRNLYRICTYMVFVR